LFISVPLISETISGPEIFSKGYQKEISGFG